MSDKPTEWITAKVRVNVSKADGGRAALYGVLVRDVSIPTHPAMPDHLDIEIVTNHRLTVKTRPLTWDVSSQEYRLADVTVVLSTAEITQLHGREPGFRANPS